MPHREVRLRAGGGAGLLRLPTLLHPPLCKEGFLRSLVQKFQKPLANYANETNSEVIRGWL